MLELILIIFILLFAFKIMFKLGLGLVKMVFGLIGLVLMFVLLPVGLIFLVPIAIIMAMVAFLKLIF